MLINLSNHPLSFWSEIQRKSAERLYGSIVDVPFPDISPAVSLDEIQKKAAKLVAICQERIANELSSGAQMKTHHDAVHVMGEFTFVFSFVSRCKELGMMCVASTTDRVVTTNPDGSKTTYFNFAQFRPYF